jgi:hypothetical protein
MKGRIDWEHLSVKELAAVICSALKAEGVDAILVGGACVSIYSHNRYLSYDLDFITFEDHQKVKKVLGKLGFMEKQRHFYHEKCPFFIDFVTPPVAVGKEILNKFEDLKTSHGTIRLLRDIDCVKDRLASYYYWDDREALNQALEVCRGRTIDFTELQKWSEKEGFEDKFQKFKTRCLRA